ncbi:MAG: methylated-DNA--[protein]-cysteine S-methyltransferase [Oscillospiraceae bacterium]|nr:methylated-DNA--[protein]-cysteine S-methyltransferase [Oscillospiraceae bacterium]
MYYSAEYASPVGKLSLCSGGETLAGLWLEGQKYFGGTVFAESVPEEALPVFGQTRAWLDRYFAGERPSPDELPLAPEGSGFQKKVWEILCKIPYGQAMTYGEIAEQIGNTSARAAGGAVGHNPISIIIPCHRVVGCGGSLTGYAGGIDKKIWLLKHEGLSGQNLRGLK